MSQNLPSGCVSKMKTTVTSHFLWVVVLLPSRYGPFWMLNYYIPLTVGNYQSFDVVFLLISFVV